MAWQKHQSRETWPAKGGAFAPFLAWSAPFLCSRAVTAAKQLLCVLLGIRPAVPNHPSVCPGCFSPWGNDNERQELLTLMVARNFSASSLWGLCCSWDGCIWLQSLHGLDTWFKWAAAKWGTSKALPVAKRGLSLRGANKKWQLAFYDAVAPCGDTTSQSGCVVVHGI